jgi:hypothetical protein
MRRAVLWRAGGRGWYRPRRFGRATRWGRSGYQAYKLRVAPILAQG